MIMARRIYLLVLGVMGSVLIPEFMAQTYNSPALSGIPLEIQRYMNYSIDPCHNFYEFVCGNFPGGPIPQEREGINQSDLIKDHIHDELKKVMEQQIYTTDPKYVRNIKTAYQYYSNHHTPNEDPVDMVTRKLRLAAKFLYANKIYQKIDPQPLIELLSYVKQGIINAMDQAGMSECRTLKAYMEDVSNRIHLSVGFDEDYFDERNIDTSTAIIVQPNEQSIDYYARQLYSLENKSFHFAKWDVSSSLWKFHVGVSGGRYHRGGKYHNFINIPVGMLQGVFYNTNRPEYMNYGALGSEIAQKAFSILDNAVQKKTKDINSKCTVGRKIDITYSCLYKSFKEFINAEADKLRNTFTSSPVYNYWFTYSDYHMNIFGYKIAYWAYKRRAQNYPADLGPPADSNFKPEQLFWISAAHTRCTAVNQHNRNPQDTTYWEYINKKPVEYRIIQSFSHLTPFSDDFGCKKGSDMNPVTQCHILL